MSRRFLYERVGEILRQLETSCYPGQKEIIVWKGKKGHFEIKDHFQIDTSEWETVEPERLGCSEATHFGLYTEIAIPEEFEGSPLQLYITTGREGQWDATNPQMAAYVDGILSQGIDVNHRIVYLGDERTHERAVPVFLSVYTGETGRIEEWHSSLRVVDTEVRDFYYDLLIPWKCLALLEEDSREYEELLEILNETVNHLDMRKTGSREFRESIQAAAGYLKEQIEKLPESPITVSCVGHTHIDVAWLWTLAVTEEKAARSFSTVLSLMERYPDYIFMSSQPQLYRYVKKNQPELYERIKKRIEEKRWEPEGAMYLEADCNLTSGESLVRQFLYGKHFFKEEFGADNRILWLPDVFGYSAALPQIMEKCGIDSFMTTKISWNETNQIPFDTFWWEGIDGTKILTHFITTRDYSKNGTKVTTSKEFTTGFSTNYNGAIEPSQIKGAWQRYQQKGLNENVLVSYGYGDGGGGPTEEMLETGKRLQDGKFGCPAVRMETAGEFFERLHETAAKVSFPQWSGELYLEYHRGTYTSMAQNKKSNRKGEFGLTNGETWNTLAARMTCSNYPRELLDQGWEILMRNQFHDILPGSAIREVYEDSAREYAVLSGITETIQKDALTSLACEIEGKCGDILIFNPNGTVISEIVEVSGEALGNVLKGGRIGCVYQGEKAYPVQYTDQGNLLFRADEIPGKGWISVRVPGDAEEIPVGKTDSDFYCSETETVTPFYHLKWNSMGQISSLYDRQADRELLMPGCCGNVLMTYEDKPHQYDNWNIYDYYKEKEWPVDQLISRRVIEEGPVRIVLELIWKYLDSTIAEQFVFYPDSRRIDIHAHIDWREDQILLKALFPLNLNVSEAAYEIQYGHVKRPTTANTSWEQAKFEVCFQKWMDISEYGYGVSFLSDSKYGIGVQKNLVGLTLLKSGRYPNPAADRGEHDFTYSIYPHEDSWQEAGTLQQAYGLNNPLKALVKESEGGSLPSCYTKVDTGRNNLIVEVLKQAEDGDGEILRIYEGWNCRTSAELVFGEGFRKLYLCNMLEEEECLLAENSRSCKIVFEPFEIKTLKIVY